MGKGDKKTKRGKIFKGSFGKTRKRRVTKTPVPVSADATPPSEQVKKKSPRKNKNPLQ